MIPFSTFISGVQHAFVVSKGSTDKYDMLLEKSLADYMQTLDLKVRQGNLPSFPGKGYESLCDVVLVSMDYTIEKNSYRDLIITFRSCLGDEYLIMPVSRIRRTPGDIENLFQKVLAGLIHRGEYAPQHRLTLVTRKTAWTAETLRKHFDKSGFGTTEGIYEQFNALDRSEKLTIGIVADGENFDLIYLSGAPNKLDWVEGERRGRFRIAGRATEFVSPWLTSDKSAATNSNLYFETGFLFITSDQEKYQFIKRYPSLFHFEESNKTAGKRSGSGFALSGDGYVVTNAHVVEGEGKVKVRGLNGDLKKSYSARVVVKDANNDLAILQIDDPAFTALGDVPYQIGLVAVDVGNQVYVLGYPLTSSMGEEVKLTNGIVSSRSGFNGNVTTYQISAPVQPGNSGGPVFNSDGVVIGIISAKHGGAENVSYAIKTSYLLSLLENLNDGPAMKTATRLKGKTLADQVKEIRGFTCIVEME